MGFGGLSGVKGEEGRQKFCEIYPLWERASGRKRGWWVGGIGVVKGGEGSADAAAGGGEVDARLPRKRPSAKTVELSSKTGQLSGRTDVSQKLPYLPKLVEFKPLVTKI